MIKFLIMPLLLVSTLMAKSYNFNEIRYSDALDQSIALSGEISFLVDGLSIKYNNSDKSILYQDSTLTFKQGEELIELDEQEAHRISQYFEILLLLHSSDDETLSQKFEVHKDENSTRLKPKGEMSRSVEKIILTKEKKELREVKLFLGNSDNITISIEDEIR